MFQIIEAEIPKSVEEKVEGILIKTNKKQMESIKQENHSKPIYFKNYCVSDSDLDYYDDIHLKEARKRIIGRLRKLEELI